MQLLIRKYSIQFINGQLFGFMYVHPFLWNWRNEFALVPRSGMKITLLMIPFITWLKANDLHPMIKYKDAIHCGVLQEVISLYPRVRQKRRLYRSFLESWRSSVIMRDGGTFSHGTSSAYGPWNDDLYQMNRRWPLTVMRRAHDHPRWTRSLTSPIATLLSRPDRPGIATNHVELVIRCVTRARTFSGAALPTGVLKLVHLYEIWWWSVHMASPDSR